MNRRFFCVGSAVLVSGCVGAGVSTTDLRGKVAAEIGQVVVTRAQLAPWIFKTSVDGSQLDASIEAVRARVATEHASVFDIDVLHDLRRFYSSPDGQDVVALAYATEGGGEKADLDAAQFARVEQSLSDPSIARSVSILRTVLREAFTSEFAFG